MPLLDIKGVSVKFPFEPYPVQREYMEKVIETLENNRNAFLESPTGTGKTLCLLCATLGWVEKEKEKIAKKEHPNGAMNDNGFKASKNIFDVLNDVFRKNNFTNDFPQVIYASRTHSQLSQAMNELKQTEYCYMKAGIVASRDQLCINDELKNKSNTDKTYICQALVAENKIIKEGEERKGCRYFKNVSHGLEYLEDNQYSIPDIEDLDRVGRMADACPYYMSKEIAMKADIVFMPYNYLFDPKIRFANKINLKNTIVILDEAHNVENMCEESACTLITSTKIGIAIRDIAFIIENAVPVNEIDENDSSKLTQMAALLQKFETEMHNIEMKALFGGDSYDGNYIFELLEKAGIKEENHQTIIDLFHNLIGALVNEERKAIVTETGVVYKKCPNGIGLRAFSSFLRIVFSSSAPHLRDRVNRCYKIFIEREPDIETTSNGVKTVEKAHPKAKIINVWCFSAAFGLQYLLKKNLRSLIFTSGTLAPLKPLITEMDVPDSIQLINPHIVQPFQVSVELVSFGPDGKFLNSNFRNRDDEGYIRSLGNTILEFSKVVPDGLLVFFPSYKFMNDCILFWKRYSEGIWSTINKQKRIFVESKAKDEFLATMKEYYATINNRDSNGAIFMAIMRGKVSEGLDFADMYGRGVIVTGIPFAPYKDPKIRLKKNYLDENRTRENEMLSGQEWYQLSAIRAINQAIGRVIRHKDDYGAILFCDNRFQIKSYQEDISGWLQNHLKSTTCLTPFNTITERLNRFYEFAKQNLPEPKLRVPEIVLFEDDFPEPADFIKTDGEIGISGLNTLSDNYDDGPLPKTPFKNFGIQSNGNTNQSGVERKKIKLEIDSNDNVASTSSSAMMRK